MSKNYDGYSRNNEKFYPIEKIYNKQKRLESGVYRLDYEHDAQRAFIYKTELKHDNIIDLPSEEYQEVIRTMKRFLSKEVKQGYEDMGFLYKRNLLMYGVPGAGKTILINRIATSAVQQQEAICIFVDRRTVEGGVEGLNLLQITLGWIKDTNPDSLLVLIMEEIDEMIAREEHHLLLFLDGQMQRPNTIVLGTTNYIDKIPPRFLRPGRFSQTVEVHLPSKEARIHYLELKLGKDFPDLNKWAEQTNGCTIDDLKEVIQACHLIGEPFERVLKRLKKTKGIDTDNFNETSDKFDDFLPGYNEVLTNLKQGLIIKPKTGKGSL